MWVILNLKERTGIIKIRLKNDRDCILMLLLNKKKIDDNGKTAKRYGHFGFEIYER